MKKALAERSLHEFVRQAWHVLEPGTEFKDNWHIAAICAHLEAALAGRFRDLVINVPPRHLKSIIVAQCFPAWCWTRAPHLRFLSASYAQSLSTDNSVACRRIVESDWYQRNWGATVRLTKDQNQKIAFENEARGRYIATSVDGVGTGKGGNVIIVDDPQNAKETGSERETARQNVIDWWTKTMPTRRNDPTNSLRVIVMQRLHEEDLSGYVLAQGGWEHLRLPARFEVETPCETSIGWRDPRNEEGELLHAARVPEVEMAKLEADLADDASGQLQQRPESKGGNIFDESKWRRYALADLPQAKDINGRVLVGEYRFDTVCQFWDLAQDDKSTNDFNVGACWARVGAEFYLLALYRKRATFDVLLEDFVGLQSKWPWSAARAKYIEDKASGKPLRQMARKRISGLIEVTPKGDKVARANAISAYQRAGNCWLPAEEMRLPEACRPTGPWVNAFVSEHRTFPKGRNDDQVDTTSGALLQLDRPQARALRGRPGNM